MTQRIDALASRFESSFPADVPAWRTLGRESEFPLVDAAGNPFDLSVLWPALAAGGGTVSREGDVITTLDRPDVTFSSEVGRATVEVILPPCQDLYEMASRWDAAVGSLVDVAAAHGAFVLGYGIQPLARAESTMMTPKRRYLALAEVIGPAWQWFSLTASDQTHVSVGRTEVMAITDLTNLLVPVIIALCANSPITAGAPSGFLSAREATMGSIYAGTYRHGMPEGPSHTPLGWIGRTWSLDYLMHKQGEAVVPVGRPFGAWLSDQPHLTDAEAFEAWVWHDHYIWNSTRPRTRHGTVELRSACQQPPGETMAVAALSAGMVCAHAAIARRVVATLGEAAWPLLRAWHRDVVVQGPHAPEPVAGLVDGILADCAEALDARGRGEAAFLAPLVARWSARTNPALAALAAWEAGGAAELVRRFSL